MTFKGSSERENQLKVPPDERAGKKKTPIRGDGDNGGELEANTQSPPILNARVDQHTRLLLQGNNPTHLTQHQPGCCARDRMKTAKWRNQEKDTRGGGKQGENQGALGINVTIKQKNKKTQS